MTTPVSTQGGSQATLQSGVGMTLWSASQQTWAPGRALPAFLALIPPEHAGDANFIAELSLVLQPFVDIATLNVSLPFLFDLDFAVGAQLDATGAWIGQSRNIPVPVQNPWFSFDTDGLGWDQGFWWGPYDGTGLATLDDTTYRALLYAVRIANSANGSLASINAALQAYFASISPTTQVWAYDASDFPPGSWPFSNLKMVIGVSGVLPSVVDLSILGQDLIPIEPAGAEVDWAVTTVSGAPVFGFDIENSFISGWDVGAWGASPSFVIENVILA
jgi:hypothetical protein